MDRSHDCGWRGFIPPIVVPVVDDASVRPLVVSPFQGWVFVNVSTQGGASLCPGLTCCGPFGAKGCGPYGGACGVALLEAVAHFAAEGCGPDSGACGVALLEAVAHFGT